jgi:hypothetical protein
VQSLVELRLLAEVKMGSSLVKQELLLEEEMVESLEKLKFLLGKEMVGPLMNLDSKYAEGKRSPQVDSSMFFLQILNKG